MHCNATVTRQSNDWHGEYRSEDDPLRSIEGCNKFYVTDHTLSPRRNYEQVGMMLFYTRNIYA